MRPCHAGGELDQPSANPSDEPGAIRRSPASMRSEPPVELCPPGSADFVVDLHYGLAISSGFELSQDEPDFFDRHQVYDRCYTATYLVRRRDLGLQP
jgi:hypothetical protein